MIRMSSKLQLANQKFSNKFFSLPLITECYWSNQQCYFQNHRPKMQVPPPAQSPEWSINIANFFLQWNIEIAKY